MLECGNNFKGTMKVTCDTCGCVDDDEHWLNQCLRFLHTNYHNDVDKIQFDTIFSNNPDMLRLIIDCINKVWNVRTGNGLMHVA